MPRSAAFVLAAGVAGLEDRDAGDGRERRLQAIPDPAGEQLARRVLEAGEVVQVVVIELGVERGPGVVEVAVVEEPAGLLVHGAGDGDLDFEAVAVEARALVAGGDLGEQVSRLEAEL